ncbi:hypothetical protein [Aquicoccus sp. SU-CL01552]|uniref:hypothetical protein n=1 Tax=Aquicoccus sp. SU-CL01552 TaxID=3127656 RepID=UPI00310429B3
MSRETEADPEVWDSLRDVFHREIAGNGGDSAAAFIAILDELDARMGVSDDRIGRNIEIVDALIGWLKLTQEQLKGLPNQLRRSTAEGVAQLGATTERAAADGARNGARASEQGLEALRAAVSASEASRRNLARVALIGLPVAFAGALVAGVLFASFAIPALPRSWQWPCTLIGSEFRTSTDPDSPTTFCVIVRK